MRTSLEDFRKDSGIEWCVNEKLKPALTDEDDVAKPEKINKKAIKIDLATVLKYKHEIEHLEWDVIAKQINDMDRYEKLGMKTISSKSLSNWYGRNNKFADEIKQ